MGAGRVTALPSLLLNLKRYTVAPSHLHRLQGSPKMRHWSQAGVLGVTSSRKTCRVGPSGRANSHPDTPFILVRVTGDPFCFSHCVTVASKPARVSGGLTAPAISQGQVCRHRASMAFGERLSRHD